MRESKCELVPLNKQAARSDERNAVFSRVAQNKDHDFLRLGPVQRSDYMRRQNPGNFRGKDGLGARVVSKDIVIKKTLFPLDLHGLQDRLKILHREGRGMAVGRVVFRGLIQGTMELDDKI